MFRRLALWLMLLALPLQSIAATGIGCCAGGHVETAVTAMESHVHATMQMHSQHDNGAQPHKLANDAGKCSPCCMGAMTTSNTVVVNLLAGTSVLVSPPLLALSSVILEGPQRPPRPSLA